MHSYGYFLNKQKHIFQIIFSLFYCKKYFIYLLICLITFYDNKFQFIFLYRNSYF